MRSSQSTPSASFINPSSLSLPSPPSEAGSAQSPSIDPSLNSSSPSSSSNPGPPRKRARTDATPEERREARAHRNRIAAQNSRDRRKVQFNELENKVQALQQENEQLRAQLRLERERRDGAEKDRENAELKERVKSLEQGWEAVLKALQTQGLPSSLFANPSKAESPSSTQSTNDSTSSQPPTTAFPVFVSPSSVVLPLSPMSTSTQNVLPSTGGDRRSQSSVPAAGGPAQNSSFSALDIDLGVLSSTDGAVSAQDIIEIPKDEDTRIEDWFNEVLASHDNSMGDDLITGTAAPAPGSLPSSSHEEEASATGDVMSFDFTPGSMGENAEMDRLLDLLPTSKDEFQAMLGSVIDEGKASGVVAEEGWSWELAQSSSVVV